MQAKCCECCWNHKAALVQFSLSGFPIELDWLMYDCPCLVIGNSSVEWLDNAGKCYAVIWIGTVSYPGMIRSNVGMRRWRQGWRWRRGTAHNYYSCFFFFFFVVLCSSCECPRYVIGSDVVDVVVVVGACWSWKRAESRRRCCVWRWMCHHCGVRILFGVCLGIGCCRHQTLGITRRWWSIHMNFVHRSTQLHTTSNGCSSFVVAK